MTAAIQAIPTEYKGVKFRSRKEARQAVFFDALGFEWEYEAEGYETEYGPYLPDFWLPKQEYFWEVKAIEPNQRERQVMNAICEATGKKGFICWELDPPLSRAGCFGYGLSDEPTNPDFVWEDGGLWLNMRESLGELYRVWSPLERHLEEHYFTSEETVEALLAAKHSPRWAECSVCWAWFAWPQPWCEPCPQCGVVGSYGDYAEELKQAVEMAKTYSFWNPGGRY